MNSDDGSYQLSHAYDHFLDVTTNKTVVSMTQLIAALITIHRSVAFLADMYCLSLIHI